ncbi:beta-xylosidase [Microbacter margulisiae]|uniref:Beta-xylosidase n=2 Tax=Microbacter margulisiae TaxID=1350067 RepID=A0A7W5DRW7_9PORP|nr:beta-xylosidase [Microbacter margulisiae]
MSLKSDYSFMRNKLFFIVLIGLFPFTLLAEQSTVSKVWVPDLGNGYYKNPIIYADYSDPDVCRVGDDYYLVSSSFDAVPGLPVLHSKDLVNWTIIGHALQQQPPYDHFSKTQHGGGVWAPAIRYHDGMFYIYYPDPDYGIYMVKAKNPAGPWSTPALVQGGKGLEDPCPLWDTDGKVYLVHAYAGSRAGIRDILVMNQMNQKGTKFINEGVIVYDGHGVDEDVEGPKLYKRDGYYYILAPAGGFDQGWEIALRSKNIYGPYERHVVMNQGKSDIVSPHQGGWVETKTGQSWFLHFAQPTTYGRLVYLEPMKWVNGWPIIGKDQGNGIGEPVDQYQMPNVGKKYPVATPQTSDDFSSGTLGLQWQWQANPQATWVFPFKSKGVLRLYGQLLPKEFKNYWDVPNILMQKFPAPEFTATTKVTFNPSMEGDRAGLIVMGMDYADLTIENGAKGLILTQNSCLKADKGSAEMVHSSLPLTTSTLWLRVHVSDFSQITSQDKTLKVTCRFSYSLDGKNFSAFGNPFVATEGKWIGAKVGLFCTRQQWSHDAGYLDVHNFLIDK